MRIVVVAVLAVALVSFDRPWDLLVESHPLPPSLSAACPSPIAHAEFVDVPLDHRARHAVDCLAHHGVVSGDATGRFRPDDPVSAATFARWVEEVALVGGLSPDGFTGIAGASEPVDRGAVARTISATMAASGTSRPNMRLPFTDLDRLDETYTAVAVGLVPARDRTTFGADDQLTRAETATSVARLLATVAGAREVDLAPPTRPVWGGTPLGRRAFLPLPGVGDGAFSIDTPQRDDGTYVRFNPCSAIEVAANLEHAPPFAEEAIAAALDAISVATGTRWELHGETDEQLDHGLSRRPGIERDRHGQRRYAPVLITWPQGWPTSWTGHDALAFAEAKMIDGEIVTGSIRMNPDEDWRYEQLLWVLLHELGHVAGLGHAEDPGQVMHGTVADFPDDPAYQEGDLAGLARLGRAAGCF